MKSQYLHSKSLADAYKRLYILGNRPPPRKTSGYDVGDMAGGLTGSSSGKLGRATSALKRKSEELDDEEDVETDEDREDAAMRRRAMPGSHRLLGTQPTQKPKPGPNYDNTVVGDGLGFHTYDPLEAASTQLKVNAAARNAPIRGEFNPAGSKAMNMESDKEAQDILLAKKMMAEGSLMNGMLGSNPITGGY